jgi:outer membrane immunogenic protein
MMAPRPKADVQGSIRGKLGIAWDRVMIYGTGGVAFGGFNTNFSLASAGGVTAAGIVADFGTIRNGAFPSLPSGAFFNANRHLQENQVQGGFSYKFDTYAPAPVVSKY